MFAVDACPAAYLEVKLNEVEAKRRSEQKKLDAANKRNATGEKKDRDSLKPKNIPLPLSATGSAATSPMPSPCATPREGASNNNSLFGYFSGWQRKTEGCAVPGNRYATDGRKCPAPEKPSST